MKNRMKRMSKGQIGQIDSLMEDVNDTQVELGGERAPKEKNVGSRVFSPNEFNLMKDLRVKLANVIDRMTDMESKLDEVLDRLKS